MAQVPWASAIRIVAQEYIHTDMCTHMYVYIKYDINMTAALRLMGVCLFHRTQGKPPSAGTPREGPWKDHGSPSSANVQKKSFKSRLGRSRKSKKAQGVNKSSFGWFIFQQQGPRLRKGSSKSRSPQLADVADVHLFSLFSFFRKRWVRLRFPTPVPHTHTPGARITVVYTNSFKIYTTTCTNLRLTAERLLPVVISHRAAKHDVKCFILYLSVSNY